MRRHGLRISCGCWPWKLWRIRTDALPQQFHNVAVAAAKLLEPKTQNVWLTSGTLKTPDNIKEWLAETEKDLVQTLKKRPIVI